MTAVSCGSAARIAPLLILRIGHRGNCCEGKAPDPPLRGLIRPACQSSYSAHLPSRTAPFSKGAPRQRREIGRNSPGSKIMASSKFWELLLSQRRQQKWRSRPISRVLSWTVIPLGAASLLRSSNLPGDTAGRGIVSLFGLAPGGVCRAGLLPDSRCALTAPFHPCHASLKEPFGGLLSVALSVGLRRPGVTWHRALWSPDFPRHPCG